MAASASVPRHPQPAVSQTKSSFDDSADDPEAPFVTSASPHERKLWWLKLRLRFDPKVVVAIISFAICSSTMLVINKVAISLVPAPSLLLLLQLATSAVVVQLLAAVNIVECDRLEWGKIRRFWMVPMAFLAGLYSNMKTLQYANVETFIVIRSSTPIVICVMDYVFLGRELPNARSTVSLMAVVAGAYGYVVNDAAFEIRAYTWVLIWLVIFTFDQIYIKYVVDTVEMSTWARVYYTNIIAAIPVGVLGIATNEWSILANATPSAASAVILSCIVGVAMNYAAFTLRKAISATSFTVVGTLCKIMSVIVNLIIWDKHATMIGLLYLNVCIIAGVFYQQAGLRPGKAMTPV